VATDPATDTSTVAPTVTSTVAPTVTSTVASTVTAAPPASALDGAIDIANGSAFGFAPGNGVDPEAVRGAVSGVLGAPTHDTGWYMTQPLGSHDCLSGTEQRILRWGSLSYAFWKEPGSGPTHFTMWNWTLGDPAAEGDGDQREPQPIVRLPVIAATTADGIGVGTEFSVVQAKYGRRLQLRDDGLGYLVDGSLVMLSVAHDRVTGIAGRLTFC
jgi:hypothetical protein